MDEPCCSPVKGAPEDDKRMNSLFMPFRDRRFNPVDWDSKMKYWRDAIDRWAVEKGDCVLSVNKLQAVFRRNDRLPMCLPTVIQHLSRVGDLKEKEEFLSVDPEQSWRDWAVSSFVKNPLVWSFNKLREAIVRIDTDEIEYVYLRYLKTVGDKLLSELRRKDRMSVSFDEVCRAIEEVCPQTRDTQTPKLLVHHLRIERKALIQLDDDNKTVIMLKFTRDNNRPPSPISQTEIALFKLEQCRTTLDKSVQSLHRQSHNCLQQATDHLKNDRRQLAKGCLRKKRELEKCVNERIAVLNNIELLVSRIQDSQSDAQVMEAYGRGLAALKMTFEKAGLNEDNVLNTMTQLQEVMDVHDEIQTALSESLNPITDDELERELNKLMETAGETISDLPDVPSHPVRAKKDLLRVEQQRNSDLASALIAE